MEREPPGGGLEILLVDEPHHLQVLCLNRLVPVVKGGPLDVQQPALPGNAQSRLKWVNHLLSLLPA